MRIKESEYRELLQQVFELKEELREEKCKNAFLTANQMVLENVGEKYEEALEAIDALNEENDALESALDKANERRDFWQRECIRVQAEATAAQMQVSHYKRRLDYNKVIHND